MDVKTLAVMTAEVRRQEGLGDYTVDQVEEYLNSMNERFPVEIVALAIKDGHIRGWMGLERLTEEIGEVGRWHPFLSHVSKREDVAQQMISEVNRYALENGMKRMEIGFGEVSENNLEAFSHRKSWYETADWEHLEENLFLVVNPMEKRGVQMPDLQDAFNLRPLVEADVEKLYSCYHQTFMTGQAMWFYEMTDFLR